MTIKQKLIKTFALLCLVFGLFALACVLLAGPGYQREWWDLGTAFSKLFRYAVYFGGAAIVIGLLSLILNSLSKENKLKIGGFVLIGILTGAIAAAVPLKTRQIGKSVPPIHDITTDTINPPQFKAIAPLRKDASNPISYDSKITGQQVEAYPDIKTISIDSSSADVYKASLAVVNEMGWELVDSNNADGRIEATDTTFWFGFKDDVIIRIVPSNENQTKVDIRSKSRVGRSDLGANAKRIQDFRDALLKNF